MQGILDLIRSKALWIVIGLSLMVGLVGAYGRERNEGRIPDGNWWISRFCIIPFFAIVGAWAADQFSLNGQQTALLSALLALMGYEAVRLIVEWVRRRAESLGGGAPVATAKPYASIIETDDAGRPTAHIVMTPQTATFKESVASNLHQVYDGTVKHPLDARMEADLRRLDEGD